MKTIILQASTRYIPILAQTTSSLTQGASSAMGIVMLIGFIFGTICVVGGGFAIRRGDTDGNVLTGASSGRSMRGTKTSTSRIQSESRNVMLVTERDRLCARNIDTGCVR